MTDPKAKSKANGGKTSTKPKKPLDDKELDTVSGGSHSIVSPRDPQSGLPTGQRMHAHKPYIPSSS
jgi:bacteriocin-like protein